MAKHFDTEILYHDRFCLAAGARSPWARRRNIDLAELTEEPFIVPAFDAPGPSAIKAAFEAEGLPPPPVAVTTYSVHLRNLLGMSGHFIVALPASMLELYADIFALKRLSVALPAADLPVAVVKLKNRTLSPTVELFLECVRDSETSRARGQAPQLSSDRWAPPVRPRSGRAWLLLEVMPNAAVPRDPTTWNEFLPISIPIVATVGSDCLDMAVLL
jgi:hypothetical protein